jgi:hypothetical protein
VAPQDYLADMPVMPAVEAAFTASTLDTEALPFDAFLRSRNEAIQLGLVDPSAGPPVARVVVTPAMSA